MFKIRFLVSIEREGKYDLWAAGGKDFLDVVGSLMNYRTNKNITLRYIKKPSSILKLLNKIFTAAPNAME